MDHAKLLRLAEDLADEGIYNGAKYLRAAVHGRLAEEARALAPEGSLKERLAQARERASPLSELRDAFRQARQETLQLLEAARAEDWWRPARHPEFGPQTLLSQASYFAQHERSHWAQIARLARAAVG